MKQFISYVALASLLITGLSAQVQEKAKPSTNQIPRKVMDGLKAKFPKPEVDKWTREKEGEIFLYDIEFKQGAQKFEVDIKEDGTIDNWEKAVTIKDLPGAVRMAVDKKYPNANLKEIMQTITVKDGKDVVEGYEIVLTTNEGKDMEVTLAPDGKILEDSTNAK